MLSCLFLTLHSLCNQECLPDDGYKWGRVLHVCTPGLLFGPEVLWNLRNNPWSRTHAYALWKTARSRAGDYPCLCANNWSLRVPGLCVLSFYACGGNSFDIQMSFVISYVIGTFFMDVFAVASDTMLLCYFLELDILKGLSYACPSGLKEVLDSYRKWCLDVIVSIFDSLGS